MDVRSKIRNFLSAMLFFIVSVSVSFAQEKEVKGTVKDTSGEVLPGASVIVKGTTRGVEANFDGHYSIKVKQGEVLKFSFIGMNSYEVKVGTNNVINVVLEQEAEAIDEVVVVAYGTVKKQSLVGAQSTITSKQLEMRPITNVTSALGGIASGVQVTTSSGQPGSSSALRIRGFGSVNAGSSPVYVVDGAIYNGVISNIAAQDIESVSILKDAASTSLYGSSAGNGVILITTKAGARAQKNTPSVTYTTNIGFSRRGQDFYETLGAMDYYPLRWQQWYNDNKYNKSYDDMKAAGQASYDVLRTFVYQPYAGIQSYYDLDSSGKWIITKNPTTKDATPMLVTPEGILNPEITGLLWGDDLDWEKHLFRTGIRKEHNINVSYNTDKLRSYLSAGYIDEEGYRIKTNYKRISGRANLAYDVNKWFKLGTNISYSKSNEDSPRVLGAANANSFTFVKNIAPIYPIHRHNPDGSYILDNKGNKIFDYDNGRSFRGKYNPVLEAELDLYSSDDDALNTRSFAEFRFLPELKLTLNYSYDMLRYTTKQKYNNVLGDQPEGLLEIANYKRGTTTFNQLLDYDKTFAKNHHVHVLLGHESYEYNYYNLSARKKKAGFKQLNELSNYSNVEGTGSQTDRYAKEGYFGRINYNYSNLYNLSVSYRRDGTSRFHPDQRWGNFWSVGAGWHLKNENFLKDVEWLNSLKLRISTGKTGNDALSSYYPYQSTYSIRRNNTLLGLRVSSYAYPHLVWEKQHNSDIALEFGLFDRFRGTIEFFNKESDDLLFSVPLPASTGIGDIDKNIGKVRNHGLEMDFTFDILKHTDVKWNMHFNGTILKNKIITLPDHNKEGGIEFNYHKYLEGRSIYDYYLVEWGGVYEKNGEAMYRLDKEKYPNLADPNNPDFRGVEKQGELAEYTHDYEVAKKHFAGTAIPDLYGGFGSNISWKGFNLGVQFAYQLGGKAYDSGYQSLMGRDISSGTAIHKDMLNAWRKPGDITDIPRLDISKTGQYDSSRSDRFLISRTSLMLKNIFLSYTLPSDVTKALNVNNIQVGISGENLFLWSKRKGLNPMNSFSGVTSTTSYDYAKIVTCNFSVSF